MDRLAYKDSFLIIVVYNPPAFNSQSSTLTPALSYFLQCCKCQIPRPVTHTGTAVISCHLPELTELPVPRLSLAKLHPHRVMYFAYAVFGSGMRQYDLLSPVTMNCDISDSDSVAGVLLGLSSTARVDLRPPANAMHDIIIIVSRTLYLICYRSD
ncbi:hypothetical protein SRHO_G00236700 [Serrasalmus rhombeus]